MAPRVKLYGIPASNAALTGQLALERKRIGYKRVDLIPVQHRVTMRLLGFSGSTVPGMVVDGRRVHGSTPIMRELDDLRPEPPLFPADPDRRRAVDDALAWGEHVWQRTFRYLLPYSLLRRPEALRSILEDSLMIVPTAIAVHTSRPTVWINSRLNRSSDETVRLKLSELPGMLDKIDELIGDGVLDAQEPGAADFMIAPTTRGLMWFEDLRPAIEGRPAAEHARTVAPRYPGAIGPVFPPEAVAALRSLTEPTELS
jgi:glutathione S-transferase